MGILDCSYLEGHLKPGMRSSQQVEIQDQFYFQVLREGLPHVHADTADSKTNCLQLN